MTSKLASWIVVLVVAALIPPMLWSLASIKTQTHSIEAWLPAASQEQRVYDRFTSLFGSDDVVLVSWPGCDWQDPRLDNFCKRVNLLDEDKLFSRVVSGGQLLSELIDEPPSFSERSAHLRLRGTFVGQDNRTTGAILYLSLKGQSERQNAVDIIRQAADQTDGLDRETIFCGGIAYLVVIIDEQTKFAMFYAIPACLVALTIGWFCFRTIRLTLIAFVTAGLAAGFSLALVVITNQKVNGLLTLMPALVLVLTMSGSVHLVNYYIDALKRFDNRLAVRQALSDGWLPCVFATLTTCMGIGSLGVSQIFVVRTFGIYSAMSLVFATFLLLAFLPSLLILWPASKRHIERLRSIVEQNNNELGSRFIRFLNRYRSVFYVVIVGLTLFSALGLTRVETLLRLERFFPHTSKIATDFRWLEQNFINNDTVQVVVGFSDDSERWIAKQANLLVELQGVFARHPQVDSTFTMRNIMGRIPNGQSFAEVLERTIINDNLVDVKADLIRQRFFSESNGWRYWRIHLGMKESGDEIDYAKFNGELRNLAETRLDEIEGIGADTEVFVSGMCPIFAQAQIQLFSDLAYSFTVAFCLICPTMILMVRSVRIGLLAMIPNILPVALVYSLLGWLQIPMDVGTILTASVGLGIAVDDTLHFLEWYNKSHAGSPDNATAVSYAIKRCSRPMIQTTLICGLGLLVFAPSEFIPVRQFSIVVSVMLFIALAADLILLPVLLLSPFGAKSIDQQAKS